MEIRDSFINNIPVFFQETINANGVKDDYSWYTGNYLRKNFYRFEFYQDSSFGLEDKNKQIFISLSPANYEKSGENIKTYFCNGSVGKKIYSKLMVSNPTYFWRL
jgi:hypothetical protein